MSDEYVKQMLSANRTRLQIDLKQLKVDDGKLKRLLRRIKGIKRKG